jgi:hypothetical protein
MKRTRIDRRQGTQGSGLSNIEEDLRVIFRPVKPRPTYISESKDRLIKATQQKNTRFVALQLLMFAAACLASGVFVLVVSVRTTITLLSALGLLHLVKEETRRKRAVSMAGSPTIHSSTGEYPRSGRR